MTTQPAEHPQTQPDALLVHAPLVHAPLIHDVTPGAAWSVAVRAGRDIRITALTAGTNCSMLIFAADRVDRLNIPDTLKAQYSARIRPPMVLMSDRGTGLVSVTGSSLDWHDCLCGHSVDAHVPPGTSYQGERNDWRRSARFGLLSELRKHGLGAADLHACVNFFSKAAITSEGGLTFVGGHSSAEDWVNLRTEQEVLIVCSTAPHPLDERWAPGGVRVQIAPAAPYGSDDPSMTFRDESARALQAAKAVLV